MPVAEIGNNVKEQWEHNKFTFNKI